MKLHDIENMTAAQLKACKDDLTIEVAKVEDIAARYVQARLDAKMRDEKLASQGKYITHLEQTVAALEEKLAEALKAKG